VLGISEEQLFVLRLPESQQRPVRFYAGPFYEGNLTVYHLEND
jgi:hypothetical protein